MHTSVPFFCVLLTGRAQPEIRADVQISVGVLILIGSSKRCPAPVDLLAVLFISFLRHESNHKSNRVILSVVSLRTCFESDYSGPH